MKKYILILMAMKTIKPHKLIFVLSLLTFSLSSNAIRFKQKYQDVEFKFETLNDNDVRLIYAKYDKVKNLVIPGSITYKGGTFNVKKIKLSSTFYNNEVETIDIENGVEVIEDRCFHFFSELSAVTLPASLKSIGKEAFSSKKLTAITIPIGTEEIGEKAFYGCGKLQYLEIPGTVRRIGKKAFKDNNDLKVSLPNSITEFALRMGNEIKVSESDIAEYQKTITVEETPIEEEEPVIEKKQKSSGPSDVDLNIPITGKKNENTFCFIIANEKYRDAPDVEYAINDGKKVKEYCIKTLGVPEKQVNLKINATYADMEQVFSRIENIGRKWDGEARFIFYFSGHGVPGDDDKSAYMMPSDCYAINKATCFRMSDVFSRLGKVNANQTIMIMDACFSGMCRGEDNKALLAERGAAIYTKKETVTGNVVVLTATSAAETALAYDEKGHGMFTYFLLKELKESRGQVTLGKLFKNVSKNVVRTSETENNKDQTPSVNYPSSMEGKWENWTF